MIVRIRDDLESFDEAGFLTEAKLSELKDVIAVVQRWGIAGYEDNDVSGQFVYNSGEFYFEVVIHTLD